MSERLPITGLPRGAVPPSVIVCGDPARATQAAEFLDQSTLLSDKREYRCYRGSFAGQPVAVCSHGIGSPGAAIAFEELIEAGGRRLIRVGTCGAMQPKMRAGNLVIAIAAVQNTGYGNEAVPSGFPAVADLDLSVALCKASEDLGYTYHRGIVLSRDRFYQGVAVPHNPDYQTLSAANILAVEMECAALFIVATLRRAKAAAILAVDGNVLESGGEDMESYAPDQDSVRAAVKAEIKIALQALCYTGDGIS